MQADTVNQLMHLMQSLCECDAMENGKNMKMTCAVQEMKSNCSFIWEIEEGT